MTIGRGHVSGESDGCAAHVIRLPRAAFPQLELHPSALTPWGSRDGTHCAWPRTQTNTADMCCRCENACAAVSTCVAGIVRPAAPCAHSLGVFTAHPSSGAWRAQTAGGVACSRAGARHCWPRQVAVASCVSGAAAAAGGRVTSGPYKRAGSASKGALQRFETVTGDGLRPRASARANCTGARALSEA